MRCDPKPNQVLFALTQVQYSDAARLLAFYQLWLDDLFPKARFLDALAMVEKTGHKRQMQTMRMEWINEGKPRAAVHEDSIFDKPSVSVREGGEQERTVAAIAPIFEKATVDRPKTPVPEGNAEVEMDDLYDATPKALRQTQGAADSHDSLFGGEINVSGPGSGISANDGPPEDDLDALLAEEEMIQAETATTKAVSGTFQAPGSYDNLFEDDMEAIAEMDGFL
jgi:replication fork protection complex subunit Csm3/Swi3